MSSTNIGILSYFYYFFNGMLFSFLFKLILLIYLLILVAMGLYHCTQAFSSCTETGLLFLVVQRLLTVVASFFLQIMGSWHVGFSS